jgi:hypothetical protein
MHCTKPDDENVDEIITEYEENSKHDNLHFLLPSTYKRKCEGTDLGPEFAIKNMPCKFTKAKEALAKIIENGVLDFNPLPATTVLGTPILPTEYEQRLAGATVLVRFRMSSKYLGNESYQFYADIESLHILTPPHPVFCPLPSQSPFKRRRFDLPDCIVEATSKKT